MQQDAFPYRVAGAIIFFSAAFLGGASQPQRRIRSNIENGQMFTLIGNTRPALAIARDQGEVDPTLPLTQMTLHLTLSPAQRADQQELLKQLVTRRSRQYHRWMTPEEYAARFGVNSADLRQISAWLAHQGFSNIAVARSHTAITFSGNAAQVQAAFQTPIRRYLMNGEPHYANASDPVLPKALQGIVAGIRGMDDMRPQPQLRSHFTTPAGSHFLTPTDFATIYDIQPLYGNGIDGSDQKIVIVGQSNVDLGDIRAFRAAAGLPPNDPQVVVVGAGAGTDSNSEIEADLDLEWVGAIAKNASIIFVTSTSAFYSLYYAIENNIAPVISISYAECEADLGMTDSNIVNSLSQQAAIQGMTLVAGSGDTGPAGCDRTQAQSGLAVVMPASSPYVTGVGGTILNDGTGTYWNTTNNSYGGSALSYIPEIAWNDSLNYGLEASGGGASMFFSKPSWQTGTGVPNDGARDVPDLAFAASPHHNGYLFCTSGSCVNGFLDANQYLRVVGGTSATAPTLAGIVALLNQAMQSPQGYINPNLYLLASFSTDIFHDVTTGNNIVSCAGLPNCPAMGDPVLGFSTGPGYDQVTGLGSVDAYNMVREWAGDFQISVNPGTVTLARGASANVLVSIAPQGNFAGMVSFGCSVSSSLTNTTCSVPGNVSGSGTANLTITSGAVAASSHFQRQGSLFMLFSWSGLLLLGGLCCRKLRRPLPMRPAAFVLLLMGLETGCGDGGAPGSNFVAPVTHETGTVTINASSGTLLTNSATVSVSIP